MLSIIVPVYNEENRIESFLKRLKVFEPQQEKIELLFVDGGSEDNTITKLKEADQQVLLSDKGRGNQLQAGVAATKGDLLLFLHIDSYFTKSPYLEIINVCQSHEIGAFHLQFTSNNFLLRTIAWGSNWRVKYRNIAFGDQGIFMRRGFYNKMGGFKSLPLMEDYEFSIRVKENKTEYCLSPQKIYTSARRFEKGGILKTLYLMQKCQYMFRQGMDFQKIIDTYNNAH